MKYYCIGVGRLFFLCPYFLWKWLEASRMKTLVRGLAHPIDIEEGKHKKDLPHSLATNEVRLNFYLCQFCLC